MKKIGYIFVMLIFACSSENANDCFQTAGAIMQSEITIPDFTKILVNRDVELILTQGIETKVVVETGENLFNDIDIKVIDDELQLTDNNTCNFVRDYGITKVYVTAPNITEIRNSSQYTVSSQGVLNYPNLIIISENFQNDEVFAVGDFNLKVNAISLRIVSNKISSYYIFGQVETLSVSFFSGAGRFEGAALIAQQVNIFHRGSNDIIVNPQQSLSGELRSTGNLIAVNEPPMVGVEQFYIGKLIFQ